MKRPAAAVNRGKSQNTPDARKKPAAAAVGSNSVDHQESQTPVSCSSDQAAPPPQDNVAEPRTSREWRAALKTGLDSRMKYEIRSYSLGLQKTLTIDEMKCVYARRKAHMHGVQRIKGWLDARGGLSPERGPPSAVAFWYDWSGSDHIPNHGYLGLASASAVAKLAVVLLTYQPLKNIPAGVIMQDARPYLAEDKFQALLKSGVHVAVLADYIRFKAILESAAPMTWFLDCDALWIKPPPCIAESMYGHVFASLQGDVRGSIEQKERWWLQNYLKKQGDHLFLASPFAFAKESPVLADMVTWFEDKLSGDTVTIAYTAVFQHLRTRITHWGLEEAVLPANACSPVPYSSRLKFLSKKSLGEGDELLQSIMHTSFCVNVFWASSKTGDGSDAIQRGTVDLIQEDSLWDKLYKRTCPSEYQMLKSSQHLPARASEVAGTTMEWPFVYEKQMCDSMTPFHSTPLYRRFELLSAIRKGMCGAVYLGQRRGQPAQQVAVKVVQSKTMNHTVDTRELFFMQRMRNASNVVKAIDGWVSPWVSVIVMGVATSDLHDYLRQAQLPLLEADLDQLFGNLAGGVAEIHGAGLIHRDLHSKNVLLFHEENRVIAKIGDLGLACGIPGPEGLARLDLTHGVGAWVARAPEIFFCKGATYTPKGKYCGSTACVYGTPSDIWALGVLLLLLDLGRNPWYPPDEKASEANVAMCMVQQWGMPDRDMVRRLGWSFKGLPFTGLEPRDMAQQIRKKARRLEWAIRMLCYDPTLRETAAFIVGMVNPSLALHMESKAASGSKSRGLSPGHSHAKV